MFCCQQTSIKAFTHFLQPEIVKNKKQTNKKTNKQPKISQTEWCRKISELQNPSLRGSPLGGPRDMASNNLQLFYLFLFLFYCCDSSVSVRTFYMWRIFFLLFTLNLLASQKGALLLAIPSLCLWLHNIINVSGRRGGCIIYMGGNFGTWFIMSHYQIKNPHWYLFIYQHSSE